MEYQKDIKPEDVTILVPTKNEEEGIGWVIEEFKKLGYNNILVIDGHSTDRTRKLQRRKGLKLCSRVGGAKDRQLPRRSK